jgi:ferredoxin-nitrite reductase
MPHGGFDLNPIERIKTEKLGLELLKELPQLAQTPLETLSEDDKQRIKWLGLWYRKTDPPTLMTRIRIPGGIASSAQLRTLASIAQDFGRDLVDITTRQQVQLRWFTFKEVPEIFRRLEQVGLSSLQTGMDSIRNVVTSSVAGLCSDEVVEVMPAVREVSDWIIRSGAGNAAVANLPRKFNIHITGHRHDLGACTNDIGMYPACKDGRSGVNVMVGGAVGGKHPRLASELNVFVEPANILMVVRGIVELFNLHGPREERHKSRLKWLLNKWGEARFRDELEAHLGQTLETAGEDLRVHSEPKLPLGVNAQKQPGLVYIGAHVPVGRTTGTALHELADLTDRFGQSEARFTIEQNILLPFVPDRHVAAVLEHRFFTVHHPFPSRITEGVVSCTGIEFCPFAVIETKSRALEITQQLERDFVQELPLVTPLRIHWSGCQHACSSHHIADIGLQGTKVKHDGVMVEAVDIFVGGRIGREARLAERVAERVPITQLAPKLAELARQHLPHVLDTHAVQMTTMQAADD